MRNMQNCAAVVSNVRKHTKAYKSKQCSVFDTHFSKAAIVSSVTWYMQKGQRQASNALSSQDNTYSYKYKPLVVCSSMFLFLASKPSDPARYSPH